MSADNWAVCPKCYANYCIAVKNHDSNTKAAYGKISAEDYEAMKALVIPEPNYALREDYDIGIDKHGEFSASYHASCTECNFKFSFDHAKKLETSND